MPTSFGSQEVALKVNSWLSKSVVVVMTTLSQVAVMKTVVSTPANKESQVVKGTKVVSANDKVVLVMMRLSQPFWFTKKEVSNTHIIWGRKK